MKLVLAEKIIYDLDHASLGTKPLDTVQPGIYQLFMDSDKTCLQFRSSNNPTIDCQEIAEEGCGNTVIDIVLCRAGIAFGDVIVKMLRAILRQNKGDRIITVFEGLGYEPDEPDYSDVELLEVNPHYEGVSNR